MATFDINDQPRRVVNDGNGSTSSFPFSFQVNAASDIKVYVDAELRVEGTHYNIVNSSDAAGLNANGTGKVNFITTPTDYTPANGAKVSIVSDVPAARSSVYTSGGNITAASLETDFDTLTMLVGDREEAISRSVQGPVSDPTTTSMVLPTKDGRKNKYLAFDNDGSVTTLAGTSAPLASVDTAVLVDDAVTTSKIADNAITSDLLATNAVQATNLAANSVTSSALQNDSVTQSAVANNAIGTDQIADGAVNSTKLASGAFVEQYGNRNLLINSEMKVAQRNTSVASLSSASTYSTCDRWMVEYGSSGTFTESQSSTSPDGFSNSLKLDCTTADASPNYLLIEQRLEGQDLQHLLKGTSSAKTTILTFHVRSNKTGTYQVNLRDIDNARIIGKTYTISSADTWEKKTITFDGDTSGALDNDNANSMQIEWWLAAGSTYNAGAVPTAWEATANGDRAAGLNVAIGASTDDEFYLTGAQLEVGDVDTPFEHRSFGDELARCQRYFESVRAYFEGGTDAGGRDQAVGVKFSVEKRATPTVTRTSIGATNIASHQTAAPLDTAGAFTRNRTTASGATFFHDQLDCESEL